MAASWDVISGLMCVKGHQLTADSVKIVAGRVRCQPCHRDSVRESHQRMKAAREPRPCEGCGKQVDQAERKRRFCSRSCASNTASRLRYAAKTYDERLRDYTPAPSVTLPCIVCGVEITRRGEENKRYCSKCRPRKGHVGRADFYGVPVESVNRADVFASDGWLCKLCGRPVDRGLSWPHTESASLDHIVPLSKGGGHVRSNVQLAHLGCNIGKGAKVTDAPH